MVCNGCLDFTRSVLQVPAEKVNRNSLEVEDALEKLALSQPELEPDELDPGRAVGH